MSDISVSEDIITDIADAIREKLGVQNEYYVDELADAIRSIPVDTEDPDYVTPPTGSIDITANGENIDVAAYAKANVMVEQPIGQFNISENGDYDVSEYQRASVHVTAESPFVERYMRFAGHHYVNHIYYNNQSGDYITYQRYDENGNTYGFPSLYYTANAGLVITDVYKLKYDRKYIVMAGAATLPSSNRWLKMAVFGPTVEEFLTGTRDTNNEQYNSIDMYGMIYSITKINPTTATVVSNPFSGEPFETFVVEPLAGTTMDDPYDANNPYRYLMISTLASEGSNYEFYVLDVTDLTGLYRQDTDG